jgi:N-acetylated-alpha-linked acidic dipeptidase
MSTLGDPGFHWHAAMGQCLGLLTYHMATDTIIPFDVPNFTKQMEKNLEDLKDTISSADMTLDISDLESVIATFNTSANQVAELMQ